ncbi:formylglycine-generating enzyme family protein, partial [candidate division KSB1 bacterium]
FRSEEEDISNPKKQISVTLEPYYISKYELTNLEYYQFIKDGGYPDSLYWTSHGWEWKEENNIKAPLFWNQSDSPPYINDIHSNEDNTPVHGISFYEAESYCKWLSLKTGKNYKIPTSAQWQRAAKGPDPGGLYPWGDEMIEENFNYIYENPDFVLLEVNTMPQGRSSDGCFHMIGNAYEYALPIIPLYGDSTKVGLYSYPDPAQSSEYFFKISMTVKSILSTKPFYRHKAKGVRICREF